MKHHITKYVENGVRYAEAWIQINLFGKCFCFWKKKIAISGSPFDRLIVDVVVDADKIKAAIEKGKSVEAAIAAGTTCL